MSSSSSGMSLTQMSTQRTASILPRPLGTFRREVERYPCSLPKMEELTAESCPLLRPKVPPLCSTHPRTRQRQQRRTFTGPYQDPIPLQSNFMASHSIFAVCGTLPSTSKELFTLFGMVSRELGFYVESIQQGFPDCEAKYLYDSKKNLWARARIEFEFKASSFKEHGHDPCKCDVIICWMNDWPDCPLRRN